MQKKWNSLCMEGVKEIQLTSTQAQQKRVNNQQIMQNYKKAFKEECPFYKMEKKQLNWWTRKVPRLFVMKLIKTTICARSVQHYAQDNMAGESPKKRGPDGGIAADDLNLLIIAYESFVRIKQIYAETADNTHYQLDKCIDSILKSGSTKDHLRQWFQIVSMIDFSAKVSNLVEECHLCLTTLVW